MATRTRKPPQSELEERKETAFLSRCLVTACANAMNGLGFSSDCAADRHARRPRTPPTRRTRPTLVSAATTTTDDKPDRLERFGLSFLARRAVAKPSARAAASARTRILTTTQQLELKRVQNRTVFRGASTKDGLRSMGRKLLRIVPHGMAPRLPEADVRTAAAADIVKGRAPGRTREADAAHFASGG